MQMAVELVKDLALFALAQVDGQLSICDALERKPQLTPMDREPLKVLRCECVRLQRMAEECDLSRESLDAIDVQLKRVEIYNQLGFRDFLLWGIENGIDVREYLAVQVI